MDGAPWGAGLGLVLGLGLFLIWWASWADDGPPLDRTDAPVPPKAGAVDQWMVRAGLGEVSPTGLAVVSVAAAAAAGLVMATISRSPVVAGGFAVLAAGGPAASVRNRARLRRTTLLEVWPDVVDNLASGVRAGLSLPEALGQLAERGPVPLRPAFADFARDYRLSGRFEEALDLLKERLADPVADRLVEALRITHEVGGSDLGRLLRTLSTFLREDARTRAELLARQSWTVNAARLAVASPWVVLGLLALQPEAVRAYNSPAGAGVLATGALVCVVAYALMLWLGRLPDDRRVLG